MDTCKTCKYWGESHRCMAPHVVTSDEDEPDADGVVACSNYGYGGGYLATGPDFGCIHHEGK